MDPIALAMLGIAGAQALTSIWSAGQQTSANEAATAQQEQWQEEVAAYNSPEAQLQRLQAAGLNPYAFMGSPAVMSGAGVSFPAAVTPDFSGAFQTLAAVPQTVATIQDAQARTDLTNEETAKLVALLPGDISTQAAQLTDDLAQAKLATTDAQLATFKSKVLTDMQNLSQAAGNACTAPGQQTNPLLKFLLNLGTQFCASKLGGS